MTATLTTSKQWHFVVMGKYDAYASKKDVEVQTQDRIELSVKEIEGLKDRRIEVRHGSGPKCGCRARRSPEDCGGDQSFLGWQTRDGNERALS